MLTIACCDVGCVARGGRGRLQVLELHLSAGIVVYIVLQLSDKYTDARKSTVGASVGCVPSGNLWGCMGELGWEWA